MSVSPGGAVGGLGASAARAGPRPGRPPAGAGAPRARGRGIVPMWVRKYVTRSHRLTDSQQNALFGTSDGAPQRIKNTFPRAAA